MFYAVLIIALAISFHQLQPIKQTTDINNMLVGAFTGFILSIILWETWGKNNVEEFSLPQPK
jgi:hypothetical protein